MHDTTVLAELCKPRAAWNELGMCLRWKWVLCLEMGDEIVFGCVWLCLFVSVCVVFVMLLVASVLASMRWLLCGGDGSEEKRRL